ncbi:MAG: glycosyltransferase family 4 protein [Saprospiraceae bacterium]
MEILFITHKYPPYIGGMEKQSFELIRGMSKNHKVHYLAYTGKLSKVAWFRNLKREVKDILKKHTSIDIIHLNDGLMAAACIWLKKHTDIPIIATYHGLDITFPSKIFQNRIIKKLHRFDGGICVSNATSDACIERGFDTKKIFTVLNGVDHDLANIPIDPNFETKISQETGIDFANKKIVMTMGRAVQRKGFSWFLKNIVPHFDKDMLFLMVGPINKKTPLSHTLINGLPMGINTKIQLLLGIPTDTKAIIDALDNPNIKDNIYHAGKVSFQHLMQYLALADVFVMPNIKVDGDAEGFGLVALEASLRGAPVIASGIEGITDAVIDGKNGILLPTGDVSAWVNSIKSLLNDNDRLKKLSKQTKAYTLQHYSWEKMVEGYIEVFKNYI